MLGNCPVDLTDTINACIIFGSDLPGVRGKMARRKASAVVGEYVVIPKDFMLKNKMLLIAADIFSCQCNCVFDHCFEEE